MKIKLLIYLLCFSLFSITGCATTERIANKSDPSIKAISACSAGYLSSYNISGTIESDFKRAIEEKLFNVSSELDVREWVKGYIQERIPEQDALEAYKIYIECYDREVRRLTTEESPTQIPEAETQIDKKNILNTKKIQIGYTYHAVDKVIKIKRILEGNGAKDIKLFPNNKEYMVEMIIYRTGEDLEVSVLIKDLLSQIYHPAVIVQGRFSFFSNSDIAIFVD